MASREVAVLDIGSSSVRVVISRRGINGTFNILGVGESEYDFFFLVRMRPFATDLLKDLKLYYSDTADYNLLKSAILAEKWEYDIPGFITREDLIYIIRNGFIIPQGAMLNGRMRMDAENYYCQAIDMKPISELEKYFD